MNKHTIIGSAVAIAFALTSGVASAQTISTAGDLTYTSTPVTTSVGAGTGTNLGTFTVSSASSTSVTSIPLTVAASGGGALSNLSSCFVYSSNGTANSTPFSPLQGVTTVTLLTPVTVGGSAGSANFSIRCDVGAATPSGATFQFFAGPAGAAGTGTTTTGTTNTGTGTGTGTTGSGTTGTTSGTGTTAAAGLTVNLDVAPSVPAGAQNVALANISLGGSTLASAGQLANLPITVTAGNGGSVANLTGCYVGSAITGGGTLSNSIALSSGGQTSFPFVTPLSLTAGGSSMLSLYCSVQPATPVGSTFTISIAPNSFAPTTLGGAAIPVFAVTGVGPNGLPAATSGTLVVTASTGVDTGTGSTGGTVGVPNTGAGGTATAVLFVLALAALAAIAGAAYLRYERTVLE